jgi:hypothetical protein
MPPRPRRPTSAQLRAELRELIERDPEVERARRRQRKVLARVAAHRVVSGAAARVAAQPAFAASAVLASQGRGVAPLPRGMRGRGIYRREWNAVSLDPVPVRRAVRVGQQYWDGKTIRTLLARDPDALNPLTREQFPPRVKRRYGPPRRADDSDPSYVPSSPSSSSGSSWR